MGRKHDPFKGLYRKRHKMADGEARVYCYAWRGGPALMDDDGVPLKEGTQEFAQAFLNAKAGRFKSAIPDDTMRTLVEEYKAAAVFKKLSDASKRDYNRILDKIMDQFGDMPLAAIEDRRARGTFLSWRDGMQDTPRSADYHWTVLARVLSIAKSRGKISVNPCESGGRLYSADRSELLWTDAHVDKLKAVASNEVWWVVMMALWTGQRQGDLLSLRWENYNGDTINLQQGKGKKNVSIQVANVLKATISALPRVSDFMLTSSTGSEWTSDGFRASFFKTCARAGIEDLTFHDLRGTAVTRLALVGCTVPEIAAVTGHSLKDVEAILEKHYLGGKAQLGKAAIIKLDFGSKKKIG